MDQWTANANATALLFSIPNNLRRRAIHNRGEKSDPCGLRALHPMVSV